MSQIARETERAKHWAEMVTAGLISLTEAQDKLTRAQRIEEKPAVVTVFDYRTKSVTVRAQK